MSYQAIITRVKTRPHPNADRLQLGTCCGFQVVVGLDTKDGELGVFFPADGQLSVPMVLYNDLYSEAARFKLALGPAPSYGFFDDKRRVRAQRFRGEKSEGYWTPLSSLSWTGKTDHLKEGDTVDSLGGQEICRKYFTPATQRAQKNVGRKQRANKCFPKHDVTKQFRFVSRAIPAGSVCWITEKLHGTSGRAGLVLVDIDLPLWKRALNKFFKVYPDQEYKFLIGSKNVIINI